MNFHATPDEVFDRLGDKIVLGLGDAVADARQDLATYRGSLPEFAATDSPRGRFNWIHDRMWSRAKERLEGVPDVVFVEKGPLHDMWVRTEFRFRFKQHSLLGAVRSYPTTAALQFIAQDPDLFGQSTTNLIAGYEWLSDVQEMGDPVLSLRDGSFEDPIWMVTLPTSGTAALGTVHPIVPNDDAPSIPAIDVPKLDAADKQQESNES